jgi:hypothetical protein
MALHSNIKGSWLVLLPDGGPEPHEVIFLAMSDPPHVPNQIPVWQRWFYGCASAAIVGYGVYGLSVDDIMVPGKRSGDLHAHGTAALLIFLAMLCLAGNFIAIVVDHFDRRNNERNYRLFARITAWLGWALFLAGILLGTFQPV